MHPLEVTFLQDSCYLNMLRAGPLETTVLNLRVYDLFHIVHFKLLVLLFKLLIVLPIIYGSCKPVEIF